MVRGIRQKLECVYCGSCELVTCIRKLWVLLVTCIYNRVVVVCVMRGNPLLIQICYFVCVSLFGLWVVEALELGRSSDDDKLDLMFTCVSASTVSSMSTLEMQSLSNSQLIVLTVLMLVGGEVFTSMLGLLLVRLKLKLARNAQHLLNTSTCSITVDPAAACSDDGLEEGGTTKVAYPKSSEEYELRIKYLGLLVLGYQVIVEGIGVGMVSLYLCLVSSAKEVVRKKGLNRLTFSVFTVVSTFASCGFVPTNENMVVFAGHSGLLMMLIPQVLLGNTLFPPCLRLLIWGMGKFGKSKESKFLLNKRDDEIGYKHLLGRKHSRFLVGTVFGFIVLQVVLFCCLDWNSEAWTGMNLNSYQKLIGVIFQSVNSRHTGETILDISILSPAILVLFVVMMYLPPYTTFVPVKDEEIEEKGKRKRRVVMGIVVENVILSQLSYLIIFIIMVCISERQKMKEDPLNFSVMNIVVEVISAYGNVGFTTGYSCKRRIKVEGNCQDKWIGFVGRWSKEGKIILMLVMLFGRLKKFNMHAPKSWLLL